MAALRLDLIKNYLRPHKKELILGALCLIFVNILSVAIPMEVRNIVDDLKEGFTFPYVLNKSTWLILLATLSNSNGRNKVDITATSIWSW